ncbi:MAG: 2-succinyl-6-hydroxy-2,4-cyclohexadiene-1-carboxylate synthase [Verrucomicrobiales bacterium]|jgi:2-succinyl-6-hydroxy-2,4-cyclohexadiene-1-carboxylate synthase
MGARLGRAVKKPESLLFLHGNVGIDSDWNPVIEALSREGMGCPLVASSLWDGPVVEYATWVDQFCARYTADGQRPFLVGYSLGGRLALHALLARSELFSGAVLISTNTGIADADEKVARLARDRAWARAVRADWQQFLNDWNAQSIFSERPALTDRRDLDICGPAISTAFDVWSLGRQADLLPQLSLLPALKCPVLWLSGQKDAKFTRIALSAAAAMENGTHVAVADAGHRLPWEQPAETARLIAEFIGER